MAVAITWKIERLECRPRVGALENVVGKVHWRLFGHEGDIQESIYGLAEIELAGETSFTPFDRLTEEAVVAWVQDKLGARAVDGHKASLARAVEARLDPPVVPVPLPWSAS